MTTTMNINLSPTLQGTLATGGAQNGVYVYAVAYSGSPSTFVTSVELFKNGAVSATSISLPSPSFPNGVVYVIVEQAGSTGGVANPSKVAPLLSSQSNLSPATAAANNFSYQLFEATMDGSNQDLGDISSVNSFGLASTFEVVFNPATSPNHNPAQPTTSDTRGFLGNGNTIFTTIDSLTGNTGVQDFNPNVFPSSSALGIGPAAANNSTPWSSTLWTQYINNLKTYTGLADIQIVSTSNGMLSEYGLQYVASDSYGTDYFWLAPNTSNGATNTDWMRIPAADLALVIWNTNAVNLEIHVGGKDGPVQFGQGFTPNNADGSVARNLISGLDAGYFGATATSPNPLVTTPINLNHSSNWTTNYSYGATLNPAGTQIVYSNALNTGGSGNIYYDPYAQLIQSQSNAYGYTYGDYLSRGSTNPQITMWDPVLNTNVQLINLTLYDTNEPAANLTGYKPNTVPYIAPPPGGYHSALTPTSTGVSSTGNLMQFSFSFSAGSLYAPNANTPIDFRFYAPASQQAGSDGFVSLNVSAPVTGTGNFSAWNNYNVVNTGGVWSLEAFTATPSGAFNLYGIPVTGDGTTSWYQLAYGAQGAQTLFNIYAETNAAANNVFTNMVVDYAVGATNNGPQGNAQSSYTLSFADGGPPSYDLTTLSPPHTIGDINGDARADLLFQSTGSGDIAGWIMNGLTTTAANVIPPAPGAGWLVGATGDVNDDGRTDLIFQNTGSGDVAIWELNGLTQLASGLVAQNPTTAWQVKAAGDLDGDGYADIVLQTASSEVAVWDMNGLAVTAAGVVTAAGAGWVVKATGDVNGDGRSDILFQNSSSGDVAIWQMNGLTMTGAGVVALSPTTAWQLIGAGDINSDGRSDLIFQSGSSEVAAWQLDGLSVKTAGVIGTAGIGSTLGDIGDFNGDGFSDLAFESGSGDVAVWELNGFNVIASGVVPSTPIVGWDMLA